LEVPESSILATGTADPLTDTRIQNSIELPENAMNRPEGDWNLIHGELMTFDNPVFDLPPIDRLEGFNPNGQSMYQRVLVAVKMKKCLQACWIYHGFNYILQDGLRLFKGYWDSNRFG